MLELVGAALRELTGIAFGSARELKHTLPVLCLRYVGLEVLH